MRKSNIQMQFNWIFVLIAGALILASFFVFIQKQRSASQQKVADTIIKDIETLATVAASAKGAQPIETPKIEMNFVCDESCSCNINVGKWTRSYKGKLIFSPSRLEGISILLWSMDWKVPFRVTNFLFMTNRNVMYFFVYDDNPSNGFSKSLYQKFREVIPAGLNYEFSKLSLLDAKNENYDQVKFVFLGTGPESPLDFVGLVDESFEDVKVSAVHIKPDKLVFMDKSTMGYNAEEFNYIGEASIFAAVFADSAQNYMCNMQRAYKKLSTISEILMARSNMLASEMPECGYAAANSNLKLYRDNAGELYADPSASVEFPSAGIEEKNHNLLLEGCPLIY